MKATHGACSELRKLLQNSRVVFEERDVFLNAEYAEELDARLPKAQVPQVKTMIGLKTFSHGS